ncbi:MAG TPA: GntR family transcriptional regulator [Enterococcus columbae]|nr:GntR family transcriptional regulator [Enterococcus columbae]
MKKTGIYQIIADDLIGRIKKGEFDIGEQLSKQIDLAKYYDTSRLTIQKAIQILISQGYVYAKKGNGTFVKGIKINNNVQYHYDINDTFGFTDKFSSLFSIQSKIISFDVRIADEIECKRLDLKPGNTIYDIIRVRYLNDQPFRLEYILIPTAIIKNLSVDLLEHSLYHYITDSLNLKIGSTFRQIRADRADHYDCTYLDCISSDPILELEQVVSLKDGRPFEFTQIRYRYDKGYIIANRVL